MQIGPLPNPLSISCPLSSLLLRPAVLCMPILALKSFGFNARWTCIKKNNQLRFIYFFNVIPHKGALKSLVFFSLDLVYSQVFFFQSRDILICSGYLYFKMSMSYPCTACLHSCFWLMRKALFSCVQLGWPPVQVSVLNEDTCTGRLLTGEFPSVRGAI